MGSPAHARAAPRDLTDLAAFARLYRDCYGFVRSVVARLGVPAAAVDDATQDVFVVVHRRGAEFDPTRPPEPWLVGIARRVAFRYRRTQHRGERKLAALRLVAEPSIDERPWMRVEAERFIERFLKELSAERREVFLMGELQGLTGPEISERLEIPVDTAYTRLRTSRQLFERALIAEAAQDRPAEPAAVQRAWLLLLPRIADPVAPSATTWLAASLIKGKTAAGVLAIVAAAALPALVPPPSPDARAGADHAAETAARPNHADAPTIALPPPPPASRLAAMLSEGTDTTTHGELTLRDGGGAQIGATRPQGTGAQTGVTLPEGTGAAANAVLAQGTGAQVGAPPRGSGSAANTTLAQGSGAQAGTTQPQGAGSQAGAELSQETGSHTGATSSQGTGSRTAAALSSGTGSQTDAKMSPGSGPASDASLPRAADPAGAASRDLDPYGAAQLAAAVAALEAGDATTALAGLERHTQAFPRSPLAQARALTRIRALCLLGRTGEARETAAALSDPDRRLVRAQLAATCVGE